MSWWDNQQSRDIHDISIYLGKIVQLFSRLVGPPAQSLVSKISVGGKVIMGAPATIHVNSTTAAVTFQEFDGPNGTGNPVPPTGPMNFVSDTPATLTVDPATGKITPVAVGTATITTRDTGNGLSDTNLVTVVASVAESLVASITP
jgi:hypothetical protein